MPQKLNERVTLLASEPVVVALSAPGERRWGQHQFPGLSRYSDNRLLVRFHAAADAVMAYGHGQPTFASSDFGATWSPFQEAGSPPVGILGEVFDGEFLCAGSTVPLDLREHKLALPKPAGSFHAYVDNFYFKVEECPREIRDYAASIPAMRWTPQTKTWKKEIITYDLRNALVWARANGEEQHLIPRSFLECIPIRMGKELLYADYRQLYLNADGSVPKQPGVSCMVSTDNGHCFSCRGTIWVDPEGKYKGAEPMLDVTASGELICVIRRTDQRQKSMLITFSKDQGRTWEPPKDLVELGDFGVWPRLLQLKNGVLVLSYGRPGVWLAFSLDGTGRTWTKPIPVINGDPKKPQVHSCGYSHMLALDDDNFLLVYSDFEYKDAQGRQRKAILVRKYLVTVQK